MTRRLGSLLRKLTEPVPAPTAAAPVEVVLYTRPDCCLCHDARRVLERAREGLPFALIERNVDDSADLTTLYGSEIPVITINGRKAFKFQVDAARLQRLLERARRR